jgi:hypothetical protein
MARCENEYYIFTSISMLFSHLRLDLTCRDSKSCFLCILHTSPLLCATFPGPFNFSRIDHLNVSWRLPVTKIFPVQFSSFFHYFFPLESEWFPQNLIFEIFSVYVHPIVWEICTRFEVTSVVLLTYKFFQNVTPNRPRNKYRRFGGACCLLL